MVLFKPTKNAQFFIRFVAFILTFGILGIIALAIGIAVPALMYVLLVIDFILAVIIAKMFHVLPEWERLVLLRLGKYVGIKGPGFFVIPPFIYSIARIVDIRIITHQVEATATLTQDNVPTTVTAAIEFEIENPRKAVVDVQNYLSTITWTSTEALKNTIGSLDLKELLSNRDEIAKQLRGQIDSQATNFGINVRAVRITDIDTPKELIEELAVIARARRAAQAKKIQADAEIEVANRMAEASKILTQQPGGFKLREIQNLSEISKEESSMIIIYPSDSMAGKNISHTSVALANQIKGFKKKTKNIVSKDYTKKPT